LYEKPSSFRFQFETIISPDSSFAKMAQPMNRKGYADYPNRIPQGWRVAQVERWPINTPDPPRGIEFDIGKWRFRTYGEVDNPLELKYEEFQKLPHVTKTLDHHCIDGWSYLGQEWNGVDISTIKEMTRVRNNARYLFIESEYAASQRFPIDQDLLLADGQNGSRLSKAAGFPLRIVAPGEFGFKSRKWIERIRFCSTLELDDLERSFKEIGAFELYSSKMQSFDPWTVDNHARKSFLHAVFTADTEETRQKKREEYLSNDGGLKVKESESEVRLCSLGALKDSTKGLKIIVNGSEILLVKFGTEVYAVEPICSHQGSDLSRGRVNQDARTLKCPLHSALFDTATGVCLSGSYGCDGDTFPSIRTYKIRVRDDNVFLEKNQQWGPIW
jgi:nitrite reductase/ring-hydroxylating ferredoxin subunit